MPSSSKDDGLDLNLLKKTQILGISSFVIHIRYYGKIANFLEFVESNGVCIYTSCIQC